MKRPIAAMTVTPLTAPVRLCRCDTHDEPHPLESACYLPGERPASAPELELVDPETVHEDCLDTDADVVETDDVLHALRDVTLSHASREVLADLLGADVERVGRARARKAS